MGLDISHLIPVDPNNRFGTEEFLDIEELKALPNFLEQHSKWIAELKDENGKTVQGLYFKEIGYQRKGVSKQFYEKFPADFISADIRDFENVYELLTSDHIANLTTRQKEFKEQFLDLYEAGNSLILFSR